MVTTTQTYKLACNAASAALDRAPVSDATRVLIVWSARNPGRTYRELGEADGFLLVELTTERSDVAESTRELTAICAVKQLPLTLQW
jgi:hypothetical protein